MTKADINLVFYLFPREQQIVDFIQVAKRITALEPRIKTFVCATTGPAEMGMLSIRLAFRPTLSIELGRVKYLPPLRGARLRQRASGGKLRQYALLTGAGIPVPKTVAITPGIALDPAQWGHHVVVKPDRGRRGANVTARPVRDVTYEPPEGFAPDHAGRHGEIAQQFVYTGPWPKSYRVLSYLGRPLHCFLEEGAHDLPPLDGPEGFIEADGRSIVATGAGNRISLADDADVLALATRVHDVMPDIPALGVDIVRDAESGRLFVLETNPSGNSWTLGSPTGRDIERDNGIDLYAQFNALEVIAERSAELALKLAR